MRFRKKPVEIDAVQWTGVNRNAVAEFIATTAVSTVVTYLADEIHINTLEGTMIASQGDWIIRGVKGELYPCKPDIFEATYEAA